MGAFYTLDSVVREYINETDNDQLNGYDRFFAIAKSGLRQINQNASGVPRIVDLTIDQNTITAPLPEDYISYTGIFMCIDEQLYPLGLNNRICLNRSTDNCGNPEGRLDFPIPAQNGTLASGETATGIWWRTGLDSIKFRNGQSYGGYFGTTGGDNRLGYYRIDEEMGLIQFSNLISYQNLVIEYIADIQQVDGKYVLPMQTKEALKAWIAWKAANNKKGVAISEINYKKMEFYRELKNARRAINPIRMSEAYQAIRSTIRQSVKF
jgi:hypothetical protein